MSISIGIVGLPNVGKSTVFNALTGKQNAQVANYPFCTIQPNRAVVPVPDQRVDKLRELVGVPNAIHATIQFVDIAGLVKGASEGEGLGNQFLGNIRDTDMIAHVVRCFDDPNVVHISGEVDPLSDIEIINIEIGLADLQQLDRMIEKLSRQLKGDKSIAHKLSIAQELQSNLQKGIPISSYPNTESEDFQQLVKEMRFLTSKPIIYVANVAEDDLASNGDYVSIVEEVAKDHEADFVVLSAKLEEQLVDFSPGDKREYLQLMGLQESGLDQVIRKSHNTLGLISFFTKNENEVRAWNIPQSTTAQKAAGVIHTDFERGFIRAEVIPYSTFVKFGSDADVKAAGLMRLEGKNYIVQDGDVILFRFNV
ncbi:MAG: redox-regulated ATPase YchF [Anaerolineales bacterium]|jgi:GTP-binding protein YchF